MQTNNQVSRGRSPACIRTAGGAEHGLFSFGGAAAHPSQRKRRPRGDGDDKNSCARREASQAGPPFDALRPRAYPPPGDRCVESRSQHAGEACESATKPPRAGFLRIAGFGRRERIAGGRRTRQCTAEFCGLMLDIVDPQPPRTAATRADGWPRISGDRSRSPYVNLPRSTAH